MWGWSVLFLLLSVLPVQAFVFHDSISNAERIVEFTIQQANEVKKYAELVTTAKQMVDQVKGTYQLLEYTAMHLKDMPHDLSIIDWVTSTNAQVAGLLAHVQWIGFSLDQSAQQFEGLYKNVATLTTAEGRAQRLAEMRAARLEMAGAAMQLQSIRATFGGFLDRLMHLLSLSSGADGSKALQQIQVQQAALAQQQQQFGLTMSAVANRLVTMEQAEQMVTQQMHDIAAQQLADQWYGGPRLALPADFNGFRLLQGAP